MTTAIADLVRTVTGNIILPIGGNRLAGPAAVITGHAGPVATVFTAMTVNTMP